MPMIHISHKITAIDIPIGCIAPDWMSFDQYAGSGIYEYARTGFVAHPRSFPWYLLPNLPKSSEIVWAIFKAELYRTGNDPATDVKRWRRVE